MAIKRLRAVAVLAAGCLVAGVTAACGGGGSSAAGADGLVLNVAGQSDNLTRVFNPYLANTALSVGSGGMIYEPLVEVNYVKVGDYIPWLAKSWAWTNGNKTLTLKLQHGVQWSDGKPFSSADVVFSYNLMKKYPALNLNGIDFDTVKAAGPDAVVLNFKQPAAQDFTTIVTLEIVSQHVWSKVSNPVTYQDKNPVGTGAFTLSKFSPQSYLLLKNPHYWQTGKPKIGGLRFIAYSDNQAQANALVQGKVDWAGTYIANYKQTYLSRSKDYHYWAPDVGMDGLIPNLDVFPLNDLAIRKAISLAVDRQQLGDSRNSHPATSQIGLPMPAFKDAIAQQYQGMNFTQDKAAAIKLIEGDGYTKGNDGYYQKNGKKLAFSISFPSAYTDIAAPAQVLVSQLKDVGIKVTIDGVAVDDINKMTSTGKFMSTIGYPVDSAPTVYSFYHNIMDPEFYKPVGTPTPTYQNIERFQNATAKKLFQQYPLATTDAQRNAIIAQLEGIWIDNLPMITLFYWGYYGDWSTAKVTGFPSDSDPYFAPNPNPVVAVNLVPKGK